MSLNLTTKEIIALGSLFGVGSKRIYAIAETPGEDLLRRISACGFSLKENGKEVTVSSTHLERAFGFAESVLRQCEKWGVKALRYDDEAYPEMLRCTVDEKGDPTPPLLLYALGDLFALSAPCVAIVGTRNPTKEGAQTAHYLSKHFAEEGFCIVSGLALGCDTYAHRGALEANGRTVAFLAHGLDTLIPPENKNLAKDIVRRGGLLLSEYPFGTSNTKYAFIARDRLQGGLSVATIVVQTSTEGGSMHVAKCTLKAGKPLYTVYFKDASVRAMEATSGNELLTRMGGQYLRSDTGLQDVCVRLKSREG